ncbi:hypothetical protein HNQ51_003587 [Inhella inkyongensis]|uniref:DUF1631 family protein n=1 Tax=Inhella inkyongensis TaxID=392593 RepID=A0A840S9E9_9BURK|nr:DUF1631 family protein [Inhella inkyongensis]MBB5206242.1 hypothetical protein [Inhella inkyongensis]
MSTRPPLPALAQSARRVYLEVLVRGSASVSGALIETLHQRLLKPAEPLKIRAIRDTLADLQQHGATWQLGLISRLRKTLKGEEAARVPAGQALSLVADDTIEREIIAARLALSLSADVQWQFSDLCSRMQTLSGQPEIAADDGLRPAVMARHWVDAWRDAELGHADWQLLQAAIHEEFGLWLGDAYHRCNAWLVEQGVLPEVDLRPFIRRSHSVAPGALIGGSFTESTQRRTEHMGGAVEPALALAAAAVRLAGSLGGGAQGGPVEPGVGLSARAPTERSPASAQASQVMQQLQKVLQRHVPGMGESPAVQAATLAPAGAGAAAGAAAAAGEATPPEPLRVSPRLQAVIERAQNALQRPVARESGSPVALEDLRARSQAFKQVLKQAAASPQERATIEVVAMMFQSILQDERLPATVRVWFARLQMPVLRVAVAEPDFFAADDHPARRLIDRMGACALGFDSAQALGEVLEREIKRVVQVVEAYPDTGRRVFQTVLTEFEAFLANFFEHENPASRKGISLAQQVEQRETLAIQYTIELRKMLADVPVDDSLREFLFQVWADVLAVTAVREGGQSEVTKTMKRAAADLIWSAGAKVAPDERVEVIRRLPILLKTLRDGMGHAGIAAKKQDEHIRRLNNVLAAAFTAKAAPISRDRLDELKDRLQTLESMLPTLNEADLDEGLIRDISGQETEGLEVVSEGGSPPSAAMLAWARELPLGSWFQLQYRNRMETVQLAWTGARHQMLLFVSPQGRAVLFPLQRLAAYLQAHLIRPAQDEALTVRATRDALARLERDPEALLR